MNPFATIKELKNSLEKKEISVAELVEFYLKRCVQHDEKIGSMLELFQKESIINASSQTGILAGIPGVLKDNICQKGRITSCASKILAPFKSTYDATVTKKLKEEGGLVIGRANLDEFAMGTSNEYSAVKPVKNPWDMSRVAGGSSGGPVAAVAAGLVSWALGSETGGSVRLPAAFCGVVGLKPTYGRVSRYGLVAYGSSIDQIGVVTRTVYDNALVFSVIAGPDINDSSSLSEPKKDYTKNLHEGVKGLTIGVVDNVLHAQGMDPEISQALQEAIQVYEKLGARIKRISLSTLDYGAAVYFIVSRAEAASNLARFDGVRYGSRIKSPSLEHMYKNTRHDGFGKEVRKRILVGNYVLSVGHADEYYINAKKVQKLIRHEFEQAFKDVDLLLMPTHPMPAFKLGSFDLDPLQMDLLDYFTSPVNLAGIPALSIPCGFTKSKLPIGFQLIGARSAEERIFQVAHAYEQETQWHTKHPTL